MNYYLLYPEVPGELGDESIVDHSVSPPRIERLHVLFHGWLGDDFLTVYPVFFVTARLRGAIEKFSLTGCVFAEMKVSQSEEFEAFFPDLALPMFYWMKLGGQPYVDDFSILSRGDLVASEPALHVLKVHQISHCKIAVVSDRP